jgi:hypothetical protein
MQTIISGHNPIIYIIGIIISGASLFSAFRILHRKRLIDDTPTLKTQGVFIGLVELKGRVGCDKPLLSYLSETQCVQYSWSIEEHWSRQVTETYHDAEGKPQTRTRNETGWTNVGRGGDSVPFYLRDETGIIRIIPDHASIEGDSSISTTVGRGDQLYYGKGPLYGVANSQHRRRFSETLIPLHSTIYVIGHAREREDIVAVEIAYDEDKPLFVISTSSEEDVSRGYGYWFYFWVFFGFIPTLFGLVAGQSSDISSWLLPVMIYLAALATGWTLVVYNSLVSLRNSVEQAWSMVDIQLNRRSDLIPKLVKIVEGYQIHEKSLLTLIATLRAQSVSGSNTKSDPEGVAPVLSVAIEKNPELRAGQNFLQLQRSLEETEQRIALARDYYNELAMFYNTRLEVIPDTLVAKVAGLKRRSLMAAETFKRASVDVDLV